MNAAEKLLVARRAAGEYAVEDDCALLWDKYGRVEMTAYTTFLLLVRKYGRHQRSWEAYYAAAKDVLAAHPGLAGEECELPDVTEDYAPPEDDAEEEAVDEPVRERAPLPMSPRPGNMNFRLREAAASERTIRGKQREIALIMGEDGGMIGVEQLRGACEEHSALNKPNFTVNMRKDAELFDEVREDRRLLGWMLRGGGQG